MKHKKNINELSAASRLVEKFFDALKSNTAKRILDKAAKSGVETEIIQKMRNIEKESKELENIIKRYSK